MNLGAAAARIRSPIFQKLEQKDREPRIGPVVVKKMYTRDDRMHLPQALRRTALTQPHTGPVPNRDKLEALDASIR